MLCTSSHADDVIFCTMGLVARIDVIMFRSFQVVVSTFGHQTTMVFADTRARHVPLQPTVPLVRIV